MYNKIKSRIYQVLFTMPKHGRVSNESKAVNYVIFALIIISVVVIMLESDPRFTNSSILHVINVIVVILFSIEYVVRIFAITSDKKFSHPILGRLKYIITPLALIDLLAILPFYLPAFGINLSFVRAIRFIRIFRLLKAGRYLKSSVNLFDVIKSKKSELLTTLFVIILLIVITSAAMYHLENEAQPKVFSSILASFWWSVITLTTIGYGDVYPVTAGGKALTGVIALLGIGFVSVPSGIIASGFSESFMKQKEGIVTRRDFENHIVICGWNELCYEIIKNLLAKKSYIDTVVLLAELHEIPVELERMQENTNKVIEFISGNPLAVEDVKMTKIDKAKSALIVTGKGSSSSDAVLIAAAIESVNPNIHTTAIIMDSDTKKTISVVAEKFRIDEVICVEDIASSIAVNSSVNHGLARIIEELTDFGTGNNFYKISYESLPNLYHSMKYSEIVVEFIKHKITILAVEKQGEIVINPNESLSFEKGDAIFVIADDLPFVQ